MITLLTPAFWQEVQAEMQKAAEALKINSAGTGKLTLSVDLKADSVRGYQVGSVYGVKSRLTQPAE